MHCIWVRTNSLEYKLLEKESFQIVKTFKKLEFRLLDGILHNEKYTLHISVCSYKMINDMS